jgi:hypothetical protein
MGAMHVIRSRSGFVGMISTHPYLLQPIATQVTCHSTLFTNLMLGTQIDCPKCPWDALQLLNTCAVGFECKKSKFTCKATFFCRGSLKNITCVSPTISWSAASSLLKWYRTSNTTWAATFPDLSSSFISCHSTVLTQGQVVNAETINTGHCPMSTYPGDQSSSSFIRPTWS